MSELSIEDKEYIRQQVQSIAEPHFRALELQVGGSASTNVIPVKTKAKIEPILVFGVGVFLITFGAFFYTLFMRYTVPAVIPSTPVYRNETVPSKVKPQVKPQKQEQTIAARIQSLENRVWLLGILSNENTEISKKFVSKYDPALSQKYMIFDRDWRLTKMPEFLSMTDGDRQNLLKNIKSVDKYQELLQEYQRRLQELKDQEAKTKS